jgi:hypothetical protein
MSVDVISAGLNEAETTLGTEFEVDPKQKEQEAEEEQELRQLKQLAKSPAWVRVREIFEAEIERIEKFNDVDFSVKDAEVGQNVKIAKEVAHKLRLFIGAIDNSLLEDEDE